jgi:hypothetical protein
MLKQAPKAAYNWEETSARKVTVTSVTPQARQIAARVIGQHSQRQSVFWMSRAQFRTFQGEFAKVCQHCLGACIIGRWIEPSTAPAATVAGG